MSGFHGAMYKSFRTRSAALSWLRERAIRPSHQMSLFPDTAAVTSSPADIYLYTDGGSRNHGNKRGQHVKSDDKAAWAYLIEDGQRKLTGTAGEYGATNNKMEVTALREALRYLIDHHLNERAIVATLDSHYVLDPIMKGWLNGWARRGWVTSTGKPVANQTLWAEIRRLLPQFSRLRFDWTKGHATNRGNNTVDELLNTTMDKM